ncbi:MAG: cellulase family glycosylhydrolase [Akkermansiaceae bacterium]|nr:cellulase family glycosylhydrolase [Verrucomicrobiales bacterium]
MSFNKFSRRHFIQTSALAMPLIMAGCGRGTAVTKTEPFVTVRNGRFELDGKPYFYIGTNLWYGCYLSDAALPGGRQRMLRELDRLQSAGATNIRLLAGSETSPLVGAIARGITRAPGDYDEDLLQGLDFCLAEMAKRNMRAILFVSNYWQWSGSFAQYVRWITGETIPDPDLPEVAKGDWSAFMKCSARFYKTPQAVELYRNYILQLIQRRNTVNGRTYRDDPTIMTWELANEPRPGTDDDATMADVPIFCQWVDETARFIHQHAPNHLVCTGSEGIWGSLKRPDVFIEAHKTPAIDYVSVHMWLKNWGWLKVPELSPEFETAAARARDHVETHTTIATDTLKKPLVLEEFGLPRDHERMEPGTPTTARDEYYRRMFDQVAESCKAGRALQGANFWTWGGEGRAGIGKPESATALMGDPFCEPQGLNSVFDTDKSTLAVIAKANAKLAGA